MRVFFNAIGTLLFLAALYFGYWAAQAGSILRSSIGDPNGGLAAGFAMNMTVSYIQLTLLSLIAAGIFLGVAEIITTIERTAHRSDPAHEPDTRVHSDGAF